MISTLLGAIVIGAALGLLGGGGTVLTAPLLHALLGVDTRVAIAMSLPVVAVAAATGATDAWRRGRLVFGPALALAATTALGGLAGARLAQALSADTLAVLLASTLSVAAVVMWRSSRPHASAQPARRSPWLLAGVGVGVGLLTGLVGVGGGFLIVPALVAFGGYAIERAVPASLFVIAVSTSAAAAGHLGRVIISWPTVALLATVAAMGVLAGGRLGRRLPPAVLQRAFALVLAVTAGYMWSVR